MFRHCFDIGHWNLFGNVSLDHWFSVLGEYVVESHIHDNKGKSDDHLPIGGGVIKFDPFFKKLKEFAPEAVWTLEAHSISDVKESLKNIKDYM